MSKKQKEKTNITKSGTSYWLKAKDDNNNKEEIKNKKTEEKIKNINNKEEILKHQNSVVKKNLTTEIEEKDAQQDKDFQNVLDEFKDFGDEKGIRISSTGIYTGLKETKQTFGARKKTHWDILKDCVTTIKTISSDDKHYNKDYWDETGFVLHCMWSTSKEAKKFQKWGKNVFKNVLTKGIYIDEERMGIKLQKILLNRIHKLDSDTFENLGLEVITKITGYKSYEKIRTGKPNDKGIDGIANGYIFDDDLGVLDRIFMQAKNWNGSVGIDPIQRFKGSLNDVLANKGIFITSGYFTKPAIESAKKGTIRISLINGKQLVNIMINHKIGIISKEYNLIDEKFFEHLKELTYKDKNKTSIWFKKYYKTEENNL